MQYLVRQWPPPICICVYLYVCACVCIIHNVCPPICMCVCVCIIHTYMYVCMVHIYYIHTYVSHVYIRIYVWIYVHTNLYVYVCMYVCMYPPICMSVCMYLCMHVCMYAYMYHRYVCTYVHMIYIYYVLISPLPCKQMGNLHQKMFLDRKRDPPRVPPCNVLTFWPKNIVKIFLIFPPNKKKNWSKTSLTYQYYPVRNLQNNLCAIYLKK
jgi:hypothetical protein